MSSTVPTCPKQPTPTSPPESSELAVAIRVAQKMLAAYSDTSSFGEFGYAQAHGALSESLRILLRAVGAEPEIADNGKISPPARRCPAAHPEDPTPCGGPIVVTILDEHNAGADGCEHHGARLLASVDGARVYALPDAPDGAAIRVFKAADTIRPFCWVDGPRTRAAQLSRAETRARGERP